MEKPLDLSSTRNRRGGEAAARKEEVEDDQVPSAGGEAAASKEEVKDDQVPSAGGEAEARKEEVMDDMKPCAGGEAAARKEEVMDGQMPSAGGEAEARKEEVKDDQKPCVPKSRMELLAEIHTRNERMEYLLLRMDQLGGAGNVGGLSEAQRKEMIEIDLELREKVQDIEELQNVPNAHAHVRPVLTAQRSEVKVAGAGGGGRPLPQDRFAAAVAEGAGVGGRPLPQDRFAAAVAEGAGGGGRPLPQDRFTAAAAVAEGAEMRKNQDTAEAERMTYLVERMDQLGRPGNVEGLSEPQEKEIQIDIELQKKVKYMEQVENVPKAYAKKRPVLTAQRRQAKATGAGEDRFAAAVAAAAEMRKKQDTAEAEANNADSVSFSLQKLDL